MKPYNGIIMLKNYKYKKFKFCSDWKLKINVNATDFILSLK